MNKFKQYKTQCLYIVCTLFIPLFFYVSGCGSDTVTNNNNGNSTDTNVVEYDTLILSTQTNSGAADLYNGKVLTYSSTLRDIQLYNVNAQNINYLFRDGTFITPLGYECRFKLMYTNNDKFDTVSVIPGGLDPGNFPDQSTQSYGYFNAGSNQHMIIGFYLKGKFEASPPITPHQVFGVLYLIGGAQNIAGYSQLISVRINKYGQNHFHQ